MLKMPSVIHANPTGEHDGAGVIVPAAADYGRLVRCLIGRDLTAEEGARLDKMAAHNWTARVAAEAILGRDLTIDEIDSAQLRDPGAWHLAR